MPLQGFVDNSLPTIKAAWLNAIDAFYFTLFNSSTTAAQARTAISAAESGANTDITSITTDQGGLRVKDADGSHSLRFQVGSNLTNDRSLTLTTGDASRTLTLNSDITLTDMAIVKGWAQVQSTGVINASLNVTSTTDIGVGDMAVNWTSPFVSGYGMNVSAKTDATLIAVVANSSTTISTMRMLVRDITGTPVDANEYNFTALGQQ